MKPSFYRGKWEYLRERNTERDKYHHLSTQIAMSFLDRYFFNDHFETEYIKLLCEMASSTDKNAGAMASSALFEIIIEGLCDDFEELQTEAYNKVMSRIIDYCRKTAAGTELDAQLKEFGLKSYEGIYRRIENIRLGSMRPINIRRQPDKILILSRVTIGADVAVTSVIAQRLSKLFPKSEFVLIGNSKLKSIFGGNRKLRIKEVDYSRRGGLIERLSAWHSVLEAVKDEIETAGEKNVILVDPDSRLSQLGVLPLIDDSKYIFFDSRGKDAYPKKVSMAELANFWLDGIIGKSAFCHPKVWLPDPFVEKAENFISKLRKKGCGNLVSVNFGTGGNSRKRIEGGFEEKLLLKLLSQPDTVIVLDKGFGTEELKRSNQLVNLVRERGFSVGETSFSELSVRPFRHGLLAVQADIGEIAALIAGSDEFIGYDSACQHIAAALGIPTYTIFAGSNNTRFVRRWRACGRNKCEIIHVDTLAQPRLFETEDIIAIIADAMD